MNKQEKEKDAVIKKQVKIIQELNVELDNITNELNKAEKICSELKNIITKTNEKE
jgi:flagellin-specific chaperone FliS